jgi:hypothetical protein
MSNEIAIVENVESVEIATLDAIAKKVQKIFEYAKKEDIHESDVKARKCIALFCLESNDIAFKAKCVRAMLEMSAYFRSQRENKQFAQLASDFESATKTSLCASRENANKVVREIRAMLF